ncbi:MAG: ATP-dependent Clp protease adaptor ClpS [Owenweeksia sp.]
MMIRNSDIETLEKTTVDLQTTRLYEIVLFNDDVNTFDWVITSLVEVCDHTFEQAEQCSVLVHYKGKCTVKSGEYSKLKPQCTELLNRGLSAEIC